MRLLFLVTPFPRSEDAISSSGNGVSSAGNGVFSLRLFSKQS